MPYSVERYTTSKFRDLLIQYTEASAEVVDAKLGSRYFEDYCSTLDVQTIVVEEAYIDHDYLEDFAAYYVRCFHDYKRTCTRLHFFTESFEQSDFSAFLRGDLSLTDTLRNKYAGFLVLRPLPASIVGRTCLATYSPDGGRRHFPTVCSNAANLFGLTLEVSTLPFQEQDQVTAACATSALWSAFQATGRLFQHRLPSPVEITSAATLRMPVRSRVLPNTNGLTIEQMAHAIREVGLEPYFVAANDEFVFRCAVYAYLEAGIPPLVVTKLSGERSGTRTDIGHHAVAVTGYSRQANTRQRQATSYQAASDVIDKLYVHDDQVGPHARMEFATSPSGWHLTTSWGLGGRYTNVRAEPVAVLLPLYNKIRIPFTCPLEDLLTFDSALVALGVPQLTDTLVWDLRLTFVNALKNEILASRQTSADRREEILTSSMPRFMWHATARNSGGLVADVLFDATDIDSGRYVLRMDIHDPLLEAIVQHVLQHAPNTPVGKAIGRLRT